ncbi:hypothetical protein [uncultured Clostridium sp.]|uniref:hypothetical protein n=1 Tax=uncultured Clostridium sp. TaxID=59620 RepID=UPI0026098309|nr:hypothetical protein [uncultured Clostridium sp.]
MPQKTWVTATDTFLSGWGQARDKINKIVLECDSWEEAQIVMENMRNRSDMKYINYFYERPTYPKNYYMTQYKTKEDMPNWYVKGYFTKGE